jgi:hypothetical protein
MSNRFKSAREAVEAALAECRVPYDGIRGRLPRWAGVKQREFEEIQTRLLSQKQYTADQILTHLHSYTERFPVKPIFRSVTPIPRDIREDIATLWLIRWAVMWGPTRGLPMLVGKTLARDLEYRQNNREAQSRKGALPRKILRDSDENVEAVIQRLADRYSDSSAKEIWPHLFSELERLLVDPEKEDDATDLSKTAYTYETAKRRAHITFSRFEDLLAEYRVNKKSYKRGI